jgi:hypothetical protein
MALVPLAYLADTVGVDPLMRDSHEALGIYATAIRDSQLTGVERVAAEREGLLRKRTYPTMGEKLVVVGGEDNEGHALKSAAAYDGSVGQWRALMDMGKGRQRCAAVNVGGDVYVVGGAVKSAEVYKTSIGQWQTCQT